MCNEGSVSLSLHHYSATLWLSLHTDDSVSFLREWNLQRRGVPQRCESNIHTENWEQQSHETMFKRSVKAKQTDACVQSSTARAARPCLIQFPLNLTAFYSQRDKSKLLTAAESVPRWAALYNRAKRHQIKRGSITQMEIHPFQVNYTKTETQDVSSYSVCVQLQVMCLHILLAHPCLYYYLLSPRYAVLHILFNCTFYPLISVLILFLPIFIYILLCYVSFLC